MPPTTKPSSATAPWRNAQPSKSSSGSLTQCIAASAGSELRRSGKIKRRGKLRISFGREGRGAKGGRGERGERGVEGRGRVGRDDRGVVRRWGGGCDGVDVGEVEDLNE